MLAQFSLPGPTVFIFRSGTRQLLALLKEVFLPFCKSRCFVSFHLSQST